MDVVRPLVLRSIQWIAQNLIIHYSSRTSKSFCLSLNEKESDWNEILESRVSPPYRSNSEKKNRSRRTKFKWNLSLAKEFLDNSSSTVELKNCDKVQTQWKNFVSFRVSRIFSTMRETWKKTKLLSRTNQSMIFILNRLNKLSLILNKHGTTSK